MAKPQWITIGTPQGSMNGSSEITAAAYTGRTDRSGTITGTTSGGARDTTSIIQNGAEEVITVTTKTYSADAEGESIAISGQSNSANLKIVSKTTLTGSSPTYKLSVEGEQDGSWNGIANTTVNGDPGASKKYNFIITVVVPENTSDTRIISFSIMNANMDVSSGEINITQVAGTKNYATPVISEFNYPGGNIPASGGSKTPVLTYSQTWGWGSSTTNGGTISGTLASPAAGTTFEFAGATDEETGVVTAPSKGTTVSGVTEVAIVTAQVILNGKSSAVFASQTVNQEANQAIYDDVKFSTLRTPSAPVIPASGGTVTGDQITWSGTGNVATQSILYSSGASEEIFYDPKITPGVGAKTIILTYSDPVTAESKGTTPSATVEVGIITITATGEGEKTATKKVTINQASNEATYGEVSIGQTTPVSLSATGRTYVILPGLKQTVSYTSGATRTETIPAENRVQLSADYTVKTAKTGFSLEENTGNVTVSPNPSTAPRNGFVVTITATGEGGKTATKDITFNQQGSDSTLELSPTSMTFEAAGGSQTLTITSNDAWTLS